MNKTAILLALLLAGCASPEARQAQMMDRIAKADQIDNQLCIDHGTKPPTQAYQDCRRDVMQMRAQAYQADQARRAAIAGAFLASRPAYQPVPVYQMPIHPTTNCTTGYVGNQAYTHCQ